MSARDPEESDTATEHVAVLLVTDNDSSPELQANSHYKPLRARYTRSMLRSMLQLMGSKPRTAHQVSERVFGLLEQKLEGSGHNLLPPSLAPSYNRLHDPPGTASALSMSRAEFEDLVMRQTEAHAGKAADLQDLRNACSIQEQRSSVAVLLAGTSGTGKSTLAGLLAARLGITTVLSTDNIRHLLRSFATEESNPLLWASTYQAGEYIQPAERSAEGAGVASNSYSTTAAGEMGQSCESKRRAVKGYKAQSEMVIESLERLIRNCAARHESLVCEGVHLSLNFVVQLMQRNPTVVPFLIYISNADKHKERFAVRAKHMTLDPAANRYVKYISNIRTIQDYLCRRADKHMIPKVDNTNVDRSVATIHATVLACLRHLSKGTPLLDESSLTTRVLAGEYLQVKGSMWSSKDMLQIIRGKALTGTALSVTDSEHLSTTQSSPQGSSPVLGSWIEQALQPSRQASAQGRDQASSDQVAPVQPSLVPGFALAQQEGMSTSSAGTAAEPDSDVQETGSVDDDEIALENDADAL